MKDRYRWIAWVVTAVVALAGARALKTTLTAKADDGVAALEALQAEHCAPGEQSGPGRGVTEAWCSMAVREVVLLGEEGKTVSLPVLVAASESQRMAGYQEIEAGLVDETATLFLFPRPIVGAFHMCNVEAPLWIVWYREDGTPLDVQRMQPGAKLPASRCQDLYAPRRSGAYRFALEIGEGLARAQGLGPFQLATLRLQLQPWMSEGK